MNSLEGKQMSNAAEPTGRRPRKLLAVILALALSLGASVLGAAPAYATFGNMCDSAVFIGVRGTDAPAGTGSIESGRLYSSGGFGDQIQPMIYNLQRSGAPYWFYALKYPAAGGTGYIDSVNAGRAALVLEVNHIASTCGAKRPPILLMGHSQGAAVVLAALINDGTSSGNLTPSAKSLIRAVAVYGDPNYSKGQAMNAPGAQNVANGLLGVRRSTWVTQLNNYRFYGWPMGGSGQGTVQMIRSYCYAKDFFCASSSASDAMTVHNSYGVNETYDVFRWLEYMWSSAV